MKRILILFIVLIFISCNRKDRKKVTITKFDKIIIDSLEPYKNKVLGYALHNIWIEGYTNDSIKIRVSKNPDDNSYSFYYKGKIKKRLSFDYYGEYKRYFYFDPYKATEGKITIKYELN